MGNCDVIPTPPRNRCATPWVIKTYDNVDYARTASSNCCGSWRPWRTPPSPGVFSTRGWNCRRTAASGRASGAELLGRPLGANSYGVVHSAVAGQRSRQSGGFGAGGGQRSEYRLGGGGSTGDAAYGDGGTRQTFADAGRRLVAKVPSVQIPMALFTPQWAPHKNDKK